MTLRTLVLAVLVAGVVGCGSGDPCGQPSSCPNDPMATPSDITACRATLDANKNATCFSLVVSLGTCVKSSRVCNSGGTTDERLTSTKAENNCKNEFDAATSCCAGNPTSTACK